MDGRNILKNNYRKLNLLNSIKWHAYGHPNITALHRSTFEITKDEDLTPKGNCIIGVKSEYACADLPAEIKDLLKNCDVIIEIILKTNGMIDRVMCRGCKRLLLTSTSSIVVRKSTYIDGRTLCINSNKSAGDLNRTLIDSLRNPNAILEVTLNVYRYEVSPYVNKFKSSMTIFK
ncbi:MAG: DUF371 domain-containing protein [Candidatus Geothermarchaeota archaeon]